VCCNVLHCHGITVHIRSVLADDLLGEPSCCMDRCVAVCHVAKDRVPSVGTTEWKGP